ncbi:FtsX-like permease family protein [Jiella endophytica]|uniref:FtsX-like permease family protein n=1 Tax=Jiella endophytica TaxID=2558362 RepID=A0A4Y8RE56_9HYPH|nr:FtsX-like permease family protein [Jiella endophytica]TFF20586.1 FtsX-like permease family protein [Jiella endophytica]
MVPEFWNEFWYGLPVTVQDAIWFALLLLPATLVGIVVVWSYRPFSLVSAMIWRYRWTNALFVVLIAISVGLGVGLIAQERGIRKGTARAAEKFDLVVTAPGSEVQMMLATVYLQPVDVPLLDGRTYDAIAANENVALAAPIAYGDSFGDSSVIGTTAAFVTHLAGDLADGRMFAGLDEAVVGARAGLDLGASFTPAHGVGDAAEEDVHESVSLTVVGRMAATGSPWDRAILVPVESVWKVHGLPLGHAPGREGQIGPPFDPAYFPGTPAILVRADQLWANYALRSEFTTERTMAFFPGAVLSQLHGLLGDVRQVMSVMAVVTQVLVTAGVLAGLAVLIRLYARRLALLRALGAPDRFVFSVVWTYAATLIGTGAVAGIAVGLAAVGVISGIVTARTDILVEATLGWPEFDLVAGFVSITVLMALLPAFVALSRDVITDLRS